MQLNAFKRGQNSVGGVHLMIQRLNHEIHDLIGRKNHNGANDQKVAQLICLRKEKFSTLRCVRHNGGI